MKHITYAQAVKRVSDIVASYLDDEKAHSLEDDLREDVLRAIANNTEMTHQQVKDLAMVALSTSGIDFQRHCS